MKKCLFALSISLLSTSVVADDQFGLSGAPIWAKKIVTPSVSFAFKRNAQKRLIALKQHSESKI